MRLKKQRQKQLERERLEEQRRLELQKLLEEEAALAEKKKNRRGRSIRVNPQSKSPILNLKNPQFKKLNSQEIR